MDHDFKRMTDFLVGVGIDQISHTQKSYLAHLIALYRELKAKGCDEDVCRTGMFHSIYGTQLFQGFTLPLERRAEIRALIGERAEHLAYVNCAMDRPSFDRVIDQRIEPYRFLDRITGSEISLAERDFNDICHVHFYDWLEQVGRSGQWDYRRAAYRKLAERLGDEAQADLDRVYAQECHLQPTGRT